MKGLTQRVFELSPPGGIFDETVISNLYPDRSQGARNALIHRAVSSGEILRLRPGLFCLAESYRRSGPHPFVVAAALLSPSHVSFETSLWHHGLIPEAVREVASATLERSRRYDTPMGAFSFHRVPETSPRAGVKHVEIEPGSWVFVAEPLRSIADLVYIRRQVSWERDGLDFLTSSMRMEADELRGIPWQLFDEIRGSIRSRRVRAYLDGLRQVLGQ